MCISGENFKLQNVIGSKIEWCSVPLILTHVVKLEKNLLESVVKLPF